MSDITAYIGEPDYEAAADALCKAVIGGRKSKYIKNQARRTVDAALAGMETVTLTKVWGKESSPGSIHKVEWIAEYIGDSRASHRRLVGPWEPVEE